MNAILQDKLTKIFSQLVHDSIEQQNMMLSPYAEMYITDILTDLSSTTHKIATKSIFINDLLRKGLNTDGSSRVQYLKLTGNIALFVSGLFPDSLDSKKIFFTLGDFIDIGRTAYNNINMDLFDELAFKFPEIVEVLNIVSIEINLTNKNILRYIQRRNLIDARIA